MRRIERMRGLVGVLVVALVALVVACCLSVPCAAWAEEEWAGDELPAEEATAADEATEEVGEPLSDEAPATDDELVAAEDPTAAEDLQPQAQLKVVQVSLGAYHSAALLSDGSLWMWGQNYDGQLGRTTDWGYEIHPMKVMDNVASVALGTFHTAAIKTDGSLWMWGSNTDWVLGNDNGTEQVTPCKVMDDVAAVSTSDMKTAALKKDGSLWMWGARQVDGDLEHDREPVKVMDGVSQVAVGHNHAAVIMPDKALWMWGAGDYGALGTGNEESWYEPAVQIMSGVSSTAQGYYYGAAVKSDSSLWMWGDNFDGELGDGSFEERHTPFKLMDGVARVVLSAFDYPHCAAIKTDGTLWLWGHNYYGRIGSYTYDSESCLPAQIMADVVDASLGYHHSAAVKSDGTLWVWGQNENGQLGDGTTEDRHKPVCIFANGAWQEVHELPESETTTTGKRQYPDYAGLCREIGLNYTDGEFFQAASPISIAGTAEYGDLNPLSWNSYCVPGLETTRVGDERCDAMVPQGICVTDRFILITAYCSWPEERGLRASLNKNLGIGGNERLQGELTFRGYHQDTDKHDSVIYVLDRDGGRYLKTLALGGFSGLSGSGDHVGGIACDGEAAWVATSSYKRSGKVQECRIPLDVIERAVDEDERNSVVLGEGDYQMVSCASAGDIERASFNCWYDGGGMGKLLWIGENTHKGSGGCQLVGFAYEGGQLVKKRSIGIPSSGNGAALFSQGGKTYLALARSTGRKYDSHLLVQQIDPSQTSQTVHDNGTPRLTVPPMLEELCVDGDSLYSVYESGATLYSCVDGIKNRCTEPIDELCVGSVDEMLGRVRAHVELVNRMFMTSLCFECPVDVVGYDEEGCVVCRITDGKVDEDSLAHGVSATVVGDKKYVQYPSDMNYRFEATATGKGTMDVTVTEYGGNAEKPVESKAVWKKLSLVSGRSYEVSVQPTDEVDGAAARTTVEGSSGAVRPTEVVDDGSGLARDYVAPGIGSGEGTVSDAAYVAIGDVVTVEAVPAEGQAFYGWYVNDNLVSRDASYSFVMQGYVEPKAFFADPEEGDPHRITFSDVRFANPGKTPHCDDIQWLADQGVSKGWKQSDGTYEFRGDSNVVRQDMAAFLYRLAGSPAYTPSAADKKMFADVSEKTPHHNEIWWLAKNGISTGWTEGGKRTFRPGSKVVRQDMAAFLRRLGTHMGVNTALPAGYRNPFSDVTSTTPHREDILWLASSGVSTGWTEKNGTKTFRGGNNVLRQDMAAFLHRLYNLA